MVVQKLAYSALPLVMSNQPNADYMKTNPKSTVPLEPFVSDNTDSRVLRNPRVQVKRVDGDIERAPARVLTLCCVRAVTELPSLLTQTHRSTQHDKVITSIDWAPNSNHIVTASQDRNAYVWTQSPDPLTAHMVWKPTTLRPMFAGITMLSYLSISAIAICPFDPKSDWWVSRQLKKPSAPPSTGKEYCVIEVNARLSRSSALASKATGYPLAYTAAKIALGHTLPELPNAIPKWDLAKFTSQVDRKVGSAMKSVEEVMAIGRTFEESLQQAIRQIDPRYAGFEAYAKPEDLDYALSHPTDTRLFVIAYAFFDKRYTVEMIHELTKIDKTPAPSAISHDLMKQAKRMGCPDTRIAELVSASEGDVSTYRKALGVVPFVKCIDTLAAKFPAHTNYLACCRRATKTRTLDRSLPVQEEPDEYEQKQQQQAAPRQCASAALPTPSSDLDPTKDLEHDAEGTLALEGDPTEGENSHTPRLPSSMLFEQEHVARGIHEVMQSDKSVKSGAEAGSKSFNSADFQHTLKKLQQPDMPSNGPPAAFYPQVQLPPIYLPPLPPFSRTEYRSSYPNWIPDFYHNYAEELEFFDEAAASIGGRPPYSPVPPGTPYPYPFLHIRRGFVYPVAPTSACIVSASVYDPNVVQEQFRMQM
ncbi:hypothetical protein DFH11DRAFT_1883054 [Phellopilus nigrolimitatus]|nr:hypothetical protein DFH11DRAFT_1883054 [Phellopilus nigrolimitatus]